VSSPLRAVLGAIDGGARSRAELVRRTGLRADVVAAALDHLVRTGHLEASAIGSGCPTGGCGSCAVRVGCASLGLVQLSRPRSSGRMDQCRTTG
jgi:hypothetical protein